MSETIPKSVMAEAMRALMVNQPEMVESVARALLARDERAAKIALRNAPATQDGADVPLQDMAYRIASAIRNRSKS